MTRDEAKKVLAFLAGAFPTWKADEGTARFWLAKLERLDLEVAKQAADALTDELKFPPSWAEFKARYQGLDPRRAVNHRSMELHALELRELRSRLSVSELARLPPDGSAAEVIAGEAARRQLGEQETALTDDDRAACRLRVDQIVRRLSAPRT